MSAEIITLIETLAGENPFGPSSSRPAANKLEELLAQGADLSAAAPVLVSHLYEFDPQRVQPMVLRILSKTMSASALLNLVKEVGAAVNSRDRERRRQAADILLAWAACDCGRLAPQEVFAFLASAFTHKDNVLRKKVVERFYHPVAWTPDFSALLPVLLAVYDGNDEAAQYGVDKCLVRAAEAGLAIDAGLPHLERRIPRRGGALAALIAHHVYRNDAPRAVALFREHGGGSYECQEVGQRVRPAHPAAGIAVLCAGLDHADPRTRYTAALGLQKLAEEGFDISAAFAPLERALADSAPIKLALTKVGEQAARALAAAARQESVRSKVLDILRAAERSGNKTAVKHARNAFGPIEAATRGADACYQEARALWARAVDQSLYDDKNMIRSVTPILERALQQVPTHVKALALLCDLLMVAEAYDEALKLATRLREVEPDARAHQERLSLLQKPAGADRRGAICQYTAGRWLTTEDW